MKTKPQTFNRHVERISIDTLRMPVAMVSAMSGPSVDQAINNLKNLGYTESEITELNS